MANEIFALQLKEFAEKAQANVQTVVRKVAQDIGTNVVMKSPVDTGRFRGNWVASVGVPSTNVDPMRVDPSGQVTVDSLSAVIKDADINQDIYVMNNLPYAIPLEYGHSQQAPFGMVRVSVANFQNYVNKAVSELEK